MQIEILSALQGIDDIQISKFVCVVIDVLRASSTILCLMEHGAEKVKVVKTVDAALALKSKGYVLVGERDDTVLEGFEFDNSPFMVAQHNWEGKKVVVTTTNGTRALVAVKDAHQVVVAGFRNIDAVAVYVRWYSQPVAIIPIGDMGAPRLEDEKCAEMLHARIIGEAFDWNTTKEEILLEKEAKIRRKGESYGRDVEFSLALNTTRIVPVMGEELVLHRQEV